MRLHLVTGAVSCVFLALAASSADAQDAAKGRELFQACLACHSTSQEQGGDTGPELTGVVGRKVASQAGFEYSDALIARGAGGMAWTEDNLDKYLADPAGFIAESKMAWAVENAGDRKHIIAYLKTLK